MTVKKKKKRKNNLTIITSQSLFLPYLSPQQKLGVEHLIISLSN